MFWGLSIITNIQLASPVVMLTVPKWTSWSERCWEIPVLTPVALWSCRQLDVHSVHYHCWYNTKSAVFAAVFQVSEAVEGKCYRIYILKPWPSAGWSLEIDLWELLRLRWGPANGSPSHDGSRKDRFILLPILPLSSLLPDLPHLPFCVSPLLPSFLWCMRQVMWGYKQASPHKKADLLGTWIWLSNLWDYEKQIQAV